MLTLGAIRKLINFFFGKKVVSKKVTDTIARDWQEIATLLQGGNPSQLKQALIIADRSLDAVLRDISMGDGMAQRLINAQKRFSPQTYQKLWDAHKLRNALVHESGFEVQHFALKSAIEGVKSGLKELGIRL